MKSLIAFTFFLFTQLTYAGECRVFVSEQEHARKKVERALKSKGYTVVDTREEASLAFSASRFADAGVPCMEILYDYISLSGTLNNQQVSISHRLRTCGINVIAEKRLYKRFGKRIPSCKKLERVTADGSDVII